MGRLYVDEGNIPVLTAAQYGSSDLQQQMHASNAYLVNSILDYRKSINEIHGIGAIAGFEIIENSSNWFSASRRNFANNYPAELNFGDVNQQYANG